MQSSWDLPHNVEFDLMGRYIDNLPAFQPPVFAARVPSYIALDARLGWQPREYIEWSIVGQNLLDNHHREFFDGLSQGTEIRRGVYGMVTFSR